MPKRADDFIADRRRQVIGRFQLTTAGFLTYVEAVGGAFGADVDCAMSELSYTLCLGNCFEWMERHAPKSVHAIVTDPPYGLKEYTPAEQEKLRRGLALERQWCIIAPCRLAAPSSYQRA
ncbi:MAG: site-specific DNA-methyltransferase [Acidobacteria bacterium]|nr:site-specific DNA-methyltransferase [Acidobacteriota bacterium]